MTEILWASVITGIFSVLVALIQKVRKENKEDHNLVQDSLSELKEDMKSVAKKLDNHIDWHLKK